MFNMSHWKGKSQNYDIYNHGTYSIDDKNNRFVTFWGCKLTFVTQLWRQGKLLKLFWEFNIKILIKHNKEARLTQCSFFCLIDKDKFDDSYLLFLRLKRIFQHASSYKLLISKFEQKLLFEEHFINFSDKRRWWRIG